MYGFRIENEQSRQYPGLAGPVDVVKSFTYVFNVWVSEESAPAYTLLEYNCAERYGLAFRVIEGTLHFTVSYFYFLILKRKRYRASRRALPKGSFT